jgi:hypothetical protein
MKNSPFDPKNQNSINRNQINNNNFNEINIKSEISINKTNYKEYPSNIPNEK